MTTAYLVCGDGVPTLVLGVDGADDRAVEAVRRLSRAGVALVLQASQYGARLTPRGPVRDDRVAAAGRTALERLAHEYRGCVRPPADAQVRARAECPGPMLAFDTRLSATAWDDAPVLDRIARHVRSARSTDPVGVLTYLMGVERDGSVADHPVRLPPALFAGDAEAREIWSRWAAQWAAQRRGLARALDPEIGRACVAVAGLEAPLPLATLERLAQTYGCVLELARLDQPAVVVADRLVALHVARTLAATRGVELERRDAEVATAGCRVVGTTLADACRRLTPLDQPWQRPPQQPRSQPMTRRDWKLARLWLRPQQFV
jgi:hypothetical protein